MSYNNIKKVVKINGSTLIWTYLLRLMRNAERKNVGKLDSLFRFSPFPVLLVRKAHATTVFLTSGIISLQNILAA